MRIFYLANNRVGSEALSWLRDQGENIVGLAIHPLERRRFGDEILSAIDLAPEFIFDGSQLGQAEIVSQIGALHPDIALSVYFGYILKPMFIETFPLGVINLHPSYLPYNRGANPNIWSILDGTPTGATLHYVDPGIDTGDVIARRRIDVEPIDTGKSLYHRLETCCIELLADTWPLIRDGDAGRIPQDRRSGSEHRTRDALQIGRIDLDRDYTARELIDLVRALTFPPYPGAYFVEEGRKVYLRLQLCYEEGLDQ